MAMLQCLQLSAKEFQDTLRLCYSKQPLNLDDTYDSCCQQFLFEHAMLCKKGSLVMQWHKAGKQEWIAFAKLAYGKSLVGDKPKNFFGCNMWISASKTASNITIPSLHNHPGLEASGDPFIDGFWVSRTTCIFDSYITNIHASSCKKHPPAYTIKNADMSKKKRYLCECKAQCHDFMILV